LTRVIAGASAILVVALGFIIRREFIVEQTGQIAVVVEGKAEFTERAETIINSTLSAATNLIAGTNAARPTASVVATLLSVTGRDALDACTLQTQTVVNSTFDGEAIPTRSATPIISALLSVTIGQTGNTLAFHTKLIVDSSFQREAVAATTPTTIVPTGLPAAGHDALPIPLLPSHILLARIILITAIGIASRSIQGD
jgi:hypothetical protein